MGRKPGFRKRIGLELFRRLENDRIAAHELHTLFWECTLRCNLNCRAETTLPDMPAADFFHTLDTQITPHVDPHRVLVILSGGEVLLRNDLEQIGAGLYRREYPWGLVTNGMAFDKQRFDSLLDAGLHTLSISLDGFADEHTFIRRDPRSFERASEAIRLVAADGTLAWDVVTCVTRPLLPRLEAFKTYLLSLGVTSWRIFTVFPVGRAAAVSGFQLSDDEFTALLDFIHRARKEGRIHVSYACEGFLGNYESEVRDSFYHCAAGVSTASIRIDGAISGCTSIRSNFHQGNIYSDDFWEVWQHRFEKFRNREWARKGACADCAMFRHCRGNGMHLYDNSGELLVCHYRRIVE